ncbi:peptidase, S54 family [Teladorsagia circumcincta]|uniref:Peptidase, S54 family n=1 Tax=Teladorsagia circumcincta TaxID=45464 RepID=A0A2G9UDT8_TELCI|nr:peptidase, S54 family [Teladorsagia circumcincta]
MYFEVDFGSKDHLSNYEMIKSRLFSEKPTKMVTSKKAQSSQVKRALYLIADQVITPQQRVEVHSYIDEYSCYPPPLFILFITLVEIAVFFHYYYTEPMLPNEDIFTFCAGCHVDNHIGPLLFAPKLRAQVWRFLTYALLHAGLIHLLGNMAVQIVIGIPLEVVHKPWRIAPLYLMAVLTGSLLQYTLDPKVYMVGASAGVYALLTAHLANVFINWAEMPYRWVRLTLISIFLTFDIGNAIFRRICSDECETVDSLQDDTCMASYLTITSGLAFGSHRWRNHWILFWCGDSLQYCGMSHFLESYILSKICPIKPGRRRGLS